MNFRIVVYLSLLLTGFALSRVSSDSNSSIPSVSPVVELPSGLARLLFEGSGDNPKGHITCYVVLYGMPGYQNAQAQGACYEAQTACLRLGLIQQFMQGKKNKDFAQMYPGSSFPLGELKSVLNASMQEVKLKLVGCAVATAASVVTDSVIDQAGFLSPIEMEQYKNSAPEPTLSQIETLSSPQSSSEPSPEPSSESPVGSPTEPSDSLTPLPEEPQENQRDTVTVS